VPQQPKASNLASSFPAHNLSPVVIRKNNQRVTFLIKQVEKIIKRRQNEELILIGRIKKLIKHTFNVNVSTNLSETVAKLEL
jgi:hypothetical protein